MSVFYDALFVCLYIVTFDLSPTGSLKRQRIHLAMRTNDNVCPTSLSICYCCVLSPRRQTTALCLLTMQTRCAHDRLRHQHECRCIRWHSPTDRCMRVCVLHRLRVFVDLHSLYEKSSARIVYIATVACSWGCWWRYAFALSGRCLLCSYTPRALPWAGSSLPLRGAVTNMVLLRAIWQYS
jgi:hypothetical protein